MYRIKRVVNNELNRIIKELKLPKYIRTHSKLEMRNDGAKHRFYVVIDNIDVFTISLDTLYFQDKKIIQKSIKQEVENFVNKMYRININNLQ
jgi:hypothetical protein